MRGVKGKEGRKEGERADGGPTLGPAQCPVPKCRHKRHTRDEWVEGARPGLTLIKSVHPHNRRDNGLILTELTTNSERRKSADWESPRRKQREGATQVGI